MYLNNLKEVGSVLEKCSCRSALCVFWGLFDLHGFSLHCGFDAFLALKDRFLSFFDVMRPKSLSDRLYIAFDGADELIFIFPSASEEDRLLLSQAYDDLLKLQDLFLNEISQEKYAEGLKESGLFLCADLINFDGVQPYEIYLKQSKQKKFTESVYRRRLSPLLWEIGHELKNPITCIKGCCELLQDVCPDKQDVFFKWIRVISEETERLANMAENIYAHSGGLSGKRSLELKEYELCGLINSLIEKFEIRAFNKKIKLEFCHDDLIRCCADIDRGKIEQLLFNLLDNAVKYSDKGSCVRVALRRAEAEFKYCISVCSRGALIAEKDLQNVSKRGFRTAEAERTASGSGMGLDVCRRIAELHKALLTAESSEEKGTIFSLYLR